MSFQTPWIFTQRCNHRIAGQVSVVFRTTLPRDFGLTERWNSKSKCSCSRKVTNTANRLWLLDSLWSSGTIIGDICSVLIIGDSLLVLVRCGDSALTRPRVALCNYYICERCTYVALTVLGNSAFHRIGSAREQSFISIHTDQLGH